MQKRGRAVIGLFKSVHAVLWLCFVVCCLCSACRQMQRRPAASTSRQACISCQQFLGHPQQGKYTACLRISLRSSSLCWTRTAGRGLRGGVRDQRSCSVSVDWTPCSCCRQHTIPAVCKAWSQIAEQPQLLWREISLQASCNDKLQKVPRFSLAFSEAQNKPVALKSYAI